MVALFLFFIRCRSTSIEVAHGSYKNIAGSSRTLGAVNLFWDGPLKDRVNPATGVNYTQEDWDTTGNHHVHDLVIDNVKQLVAGDFSSR